MFNNIGLVARVRGCEMSLILIRALIQASQASSHNSLVFFPPFPVLIIITVPIIPSVLPTEAIMPNGNCFGCIRYLTYICNS